MSHALPFCHLQIKALRSSYPSKWKALQKPVEAPQKLTEHLRNYRLQHHLLQVDIARRLAVHKGTIQNWERGNGEPMLHQVPKIIQLLGYDPEPIPEGLGPRIAHARRLLGFTQEDLAKELGVGSFAMWQWESGRSLPHQAELKRIQSLVDGIRVPRLTLQLF
jgi:DNA-binding transcriptional regulator YiaG